MNSLRKGSVISFLLAIAVMSTACVPASPKNAPVQSTIRNRPVVTEKTHRDVKKLIINEVIKSNPDCLSIKVLDIKLVPRKSRVNVKRSPLGYYPVLEEWTINRCNMKMVYTVEYTFRYHKTHLSINLKSK